MRISTNMSTWYLGCLVVKMYHYVVILLVSVASTSLVVESANILGIFPLYSKSHHSINQPILKGLASRGHQVTTISYFKSNESVQNYREILISDEGQQGWIDSVPIEDCVNYLGVQKGQNFIFAEELSKCDLILRSEYIKQLISSRNDPIDLIISEVHHVQCYHLLAYKLNVPFIIVLPVTSEMGVDYIVGNPVIPSTTPLRDSTFTTKMNLWQRTENAFHNAISYWYHNFIHYKSMERYAREIFHIELPSAEILNKKTALAFLNNHPSFISRPKPPNVIDMAGIHIKEPEKLPKDIEDFIEGAAHGVILFSFGTTMKASSITPEKLKAITDAFSAIPQRVLWRVNDLSITDVPPNVKLSKWFPQRDILEHKKVIAFITHCGLQSTLEAIHTATPIIGIPFMFDQFQNANILVEREVGIYIDYETMDKNTLLAAIKEIITNTKYQENITKWSIVFRDRLISPLDEVLYWIEYALKYQGAPHLRTIAADMPWYQYLLLDVLALILVIVIGFAYTFKLFFKFVIAFMCRQKPTKNKIQ